MRNETPIVLVAACMLSLEPIYARQPQIIIVPALPGGTETVINGVSRDGKVAVGRSGNSLEQQRAVRWSVQDGIQDLGTIPGSSTGQAVATAANSDGSVIVGYGDPEAFRWTSASGIRGIGILGSQALAVSSDGSVVVGFRGTGSGADRAFRWTPTGFQTILLPSYYSSYAYGSSGDGSVVVGQSEDFSGFVDAFRWTATNGTQRLFPASMGITSSIATRVNDSGTIVIGTSDQGAFRWSTSGSIHYLESTATPTRFITPISLTSDGETIVGSSELGPWIWNSSTGMTRLQDYFISKGINLTGITIVAVADISADGSTIVGTAFVQGQIWARGFMVTGLAVPQMCYANCDNSTVIPMLNPLDFACFLSRYSAGDIWANCDGSTITPVLNAIDFACFLTRYTSGC